MPRSSTRRTGGGASGTPAAPGPGPGVITVNVDGGPLPAQILAIAREVLTDARNHDSAALDRLPDPTDPNSAQVVALNKLLAQPVLYQQIVTLLTKTHGAARTAFTGRPGFLLAGTGNPLTADDAKTLGVTGAQDYKGITISLGDAYDAKPYVPKLASIAQYGP